jgi:transcriptional regulator with XRE-family HTH domain
MSRDEVARHWAAATPLAEMIRTARIKAGLTQEGLASKLGYTLGGGRWVDLWERGLAVPPPTVGPRLCPLIGLHKRAFYDALRALRPTGVPQ